MIAVVSLRSEKSVTQSRSNPLLSIVLYAPSLLTLAFQQSQYWPIWLGNRFCTSKSHTLHKEPIVFEFSFHEFWHFNRSLPCSAASAIVLCVKLVSQKFKWEEISGWRTCRIFIKLLHIISNTRSIENWRNRNWKTNAAIIVCVSCACHVTETNLAKNSQKQLQNQIKRKSQPLAYTLSVRQTRRHTHAHIHAWKIADTWHEYLNRNCVNLNKQRTQHWKWYYYLFYTILQLVCNQSRHIYRNVSAVRKHCARKINESRTKANTSSYK